MTTFQELKRKVSIINIAEYLGYQLKRKDGRTNPCYALYSGNQKVDEILIKNPTNNAQQSFCDRNYNYGDVIDFIKLHINSFPQFQHTNENIRINIILSHFAGTTYTSKVTPSFFKEKKPFNPDRYYTEKASIEKCSYLINERCLSSEAITAFLSHIVMIKDRQGKRDITNIGFPYTVPGTSEVTNYEIRNSGFKSMASGGDAHRSVWHKAFGEVKNLLLFESAIDAISFYDIYYKRKNFAGCAFVSTGGGLATDQIITLLEAYKPQKMVCCFDRDEQGFKYRLKVEKIIEGWNLMEKGEISVVSVLPKDKDFNDDLKKIKQ
jgi:hypothetical protein